LGQTSAWGSNAQSPRTTSVTFTLADSLNFREPRPRIRGHARRPTCRATRNLAYEDESGRFAPGAGDPDAASTQTNGPVPIPLSHPPRLASTGCGQDWRASTCNSFFASTPNFTASATGERSARESSYPLPVNIALAVAGPQLGDTSCPKVAYHTPLLGVLGCTGGFTRPTRIGENPWPYSRITPRARVPHRERRLRGLEPTLYNYFSSLRPTNLIFLSTSTFRSRRELGRAVVSSIPLSRAPSYLTVAVFRTIRRLSCFTTARVGTFHLLRAVFTENRFVGATALAGRLTMSRWALNHALIRVFSATGLERVSAGLGKSNYLDYTTSTRSRPRVTLRPRAADLHDLRPTSRAFASAQPTQRHWGDNHRSTPDFSSSPRIAESSRWRPLPPRSRAIVNQIKRRLPRRARLGVDLTQPPSPRSSHQIDVLDHGRSPATSNRSGRVGTGKAGFGPQGPRGRFQGVSHRNAGVLHAAGPWRNRFNPSKSINQPPRAQQ